jgi:hypothetical protein
MMLARSLDSELIVFLRGLEWDGDDEVYLLSEIVVSRAELEPATNRLTKAVKPISSQSRLLKIY